MNLCKRYVVEFANDIKKTAPKTIDAEKLTEDIDKITNNVVYGYITNFEAIKLLSEISGNLTKYIK